jgi:hypothetical protein
MAVGHDECEMWRKARGRVPSSLQLLFILSVALAVTHIGLAISMASGSENHGTFFGLWFLLVGFEAGVNIILYAVIRAASTRLRHGISSATLMYANAAMWGAFMTIAAVIFMACTRNRLYEWLVATSIPYMLSLVMAVVSGIQLLFGSLVASRAYSDMMTLRMDLAPDDVLHRFERYNL